jgi:hypothetical protein
METKDIIKWVAIGVAGYLVYKWLEQNGAFGSTQLLAAGTTPALPAGTPVGTPVATGTPAQTPPAVPPDPLGIAARAAEAQANPWTGPPPSADMLMIAAWDQTKAGAVGNYRLNASQWNWYRTQYAQSVLKLPDDKPTQYPTLEAYCGDCQNMTATEYWAALRASGLSGMSGWGTGYSYGIHRGSQIVN